MERNYKKEAEWRKKKYKRFVVDVENETAEQLKKKLEDDKTDFGKWAKQRIYEYLEKN